MALKGAGFRDLATINNLPEAFPWRATTIGSTLCNCPLYLENFSASSLSCQNRAIPFTSLSLVWGFTVFRMKCFSSCQTSLIGFRSGDMAGVIHQLMLFSFMKDLARLLVCLGSFYLLKPKTVWEGLSDKWQQPIGQNLCHVEFSIHDAFEDHQLRRTPFRNSSLNVDFHWTLWLALYSRSFQFTMESYLAVIFHHNKTFVHENHVKLFVRSEALLAEFQPFNLVCF